MGFLDFFKKNTPNIDNSNQILGIGLSQIILSVDSAYPGDQGGGKVRLDPETMLFLKVAPGDLVMIEGSQKTVATIWRLLVEDWNQRKCRIDNFTRENAGIELGDKASIRKVTSAVTAKSVVLAPPADLPKKIPIANNPHVVNGLIDFPVTLNDSVPIMLGLPFLQPQIVAFKVVEIEPEDAVIITKNTKITFSDQPIPNSENIPNPDNDGIHDSDNIDLSQPEQNQNVDNFSEDPLKIIKVRYAKGEISKADYDEMELVLKK